jgi:hypothetical protein
MTFPLQPIGPRPSEPPPVTPVDRARPAERRRRRDDDGQQERRRGRQDQPESPATPDADGHIDVLA